MADGLHGVSVIALVHDLVRHRSIATLVWDDDPEKKLNLIIPFGTSLDAVRDEAEKALRAHSAEIASIEVHEHRESNA